MRTVGAGTRSPWTFTVNACLQSDPYIRGATSAGEKRVQDHEEHKRSWSPSAGRLLHCVNWSWDNGRRIREFWILTSSLISSHSRANHSARLPVNSCSATYNTRVVFGWRTCDAARRECVECGVISTPVTCRPIVLPPD